MSRLTPSRKLPLLLLSPVLLLIAGFAVFVGLSYSGGYDPAQSFTSALETETPEMELLVRYSARCLMIPFQLIFIGLIGGTALAIYRRRWRIASRVIHPLRGVEMSAQTKAYIDPLQNDWDELVKVSPERQQTLTHIGASLVAVIVILLAVILSMGQFFSLTDLAVIITALTSALTWGARLPVSDVLGGVSNLMENNFNVGDHLSFRHFKLDVEGIVVQVDLRFTWLRATSGELITVPFGEVRTIRNISRSAFAGVYVSFPVPSEYLEPAIRTLEDLAPESPQLIPDLLEPWRVVSQSGLLGSSVELSLYGRALVGREQELQLAMHEVVWERLQALEIGPTPEVKE